MSYPAPIPAQRRLPRPLEGVKVIDLTSIIFGPMATQLLADMGADVIKVEAPGGDGLRHIEPMRSPGMGAIFLNSNRAKKSIVLDLKTSPGLKALKRLVISADVFVHSMRGPAAERLGIDYKMLSALKPELIYAFACGYGSSGPNAALPAYDDIIQAASGLASITTHPDGSPQLVRTIIADKVSALCLSNALMAAIMNLKSNGQGQYLEVPMYECMAHFLMVEHLSAASFEPAMGDVGYKRVLSADRKTFQTSDSFIAILPYTTPQWRKFLKLIGRPKLAKAEWVRNPAKRSSRIDELYSIIAEAMPRRTTAMWIAALRELDIPVTAVQTLEDLLSDPQLMATGLFELYDHPSEGKLRGTRNPIKGGWPAADTPPSAPRLGEDTESVLRDLGYSTQEITEIVPN